MNAVSTLDQDTAQAIRAAMAAANAGRLDEACAIGERALADGGEPAALNAMVGSLQCRAGNFEEGIRHLGMAHEARSSDPVIAFNLASALSQNGEPARALEIASEALSSRDPSLRLERLRGFLAQTLEDFPTAIASYERVVAERPDDFEALNNLGNARRCAGDFDGSIEALERAAKLDPAAAPVRLNLCTALLAAGRAADAEAELKAMAEAFPSDWRPLRELHAFYRDRGRDEAALDAIEEASRRAPDDLELLLAVASQRLSMLDNAGAAEAYSQVVERDPAHALGNLGLAVVYELTNRTDALKALVAEAESRKVDEDALNFIRAFNFRREKKYAEGVAALARVPDTLDTARRGYLWGQLNEGAGNFDEAWSGFDRMNEIHRGDASQPEARAAAFRELVRTRLDGLTPEWAAGWEERANGDGRPSPSFLVGFPRSGTTLLDTFLMGHPNAVVLEEEPTMNRANDAFGEFMAMPAAPLQKVQAARDAYFTALGAIADVKPGNVVIDKNPLLMTSLPLIKRLFPDGRIILALRHPCDAVLSCFATNFKLNDAMSSFLSLESTAELYDLSFSFFERALELLPMPVHRVRYEDLIADREREIKAVSGFVGLDWTPNLLDHQSTARKRGRIKTASYAQVVEPIYTRSSGRWRNYRKHLEPVLPILEPWVRKFGYDL